MGPDVIAAENATGAFLLTANSKDSAVVATLPPGAYSVQVKGFGGSGACMVAVYEVP